MSEKYSKFIDQYGESTYNFLDMWGGIDSFFGLIDNANDKQLKALVEISDRTFFMHCRPPAEYLNAFLDDKLPPKDFILLLKGIYRGDWQMYDEADNSLEDPFWLSMEDILCFYDAFDKKMDKVVSNLKDIDLEYDLTPYFQSKSIPLKRFIELMKKPVTPQIDMTIKEVEAIYGEPAKKKTDVMKTKTVDTWTYTGESINMVRDINALELKFENDKLTRYKDKRDDTAFSIGFEKSSMEPPDFIQKSSKIDNYKLLIGIISTSEKKTKNFEKALQAAKSSVVGSIYASLEFMKKRDKEIDEAIANSNSAQEQYGKKLFHSKNRLLVIKQSTWEFIQLEKARKIQALENWGKFLSDKGDYPNAHELLEIENNLENVSNSAVSSKKLSITKLLDELKEFYQILELKVKTGCFVATATMGDYNHPFVLDLRIFRDEFLAKRRWGKSFINFYYSYGPYPAKIIQRSSFLRILSYYLIIKPAHFFASFLIRNN